eukprot:1161365-Pelagomonas_calceolata.AAC.1
MIPSLSGTHVHVLEPRGTHKHIGNAHRFSQGLDAPVACSGCCAGAPQDGRAGGRQRKCRTSPASSKQRGHAQTSMDQDMTYKDANMPHRVHEPEGERGKTGHALQAANDAAMQEKRKTA